MLKRDKVTGRFIKRKIKVGSVVICDKSNELLHITANKPYKVVATALSANKSTSIEKLSHENDFAIVNNIGEVIPQRLKGTQALLQAEHGRIFGNWSIL